MIYVFSSIVLIYILYRISQFVIDCWHSVCGIVAYLEDRYDEDVE